MPVTTGFIQTADDYPTDMADGGAIIGPFQELATCQFTVSGATVAGQIAKKKNQDGSLHWDNFETTFAPGSNGYEGEVFGIRLRSYVPGTPATVALNAYFVDDPIPFSNPQPLDGQVNPDGTFVPPAGGGIQFDTSPQTGTFLDATTTGDDGTDGINFTAAGGRMRLRSSAGDVIIGSDNDDVDISAGGAFSTIAVGQALLESASADVQLQGQTNVGITAVAGTAGMQGQTGANLSAIAGDVDLTAGGTGNIHLARGTVGTTAKIDITSADIALVTNSGKIIEVLEAGAARKLGFFGTAPVVKQATPVTLGDVIALLQAYGLAN